MISAENEIKLITKLVTERPGISNIELIKEVFHDRGFDAGKTKLQRIRAGFRGKGVFVWTKTSHLRMILWHTAEYAKAHGLKDFDAPRPAGDAYLTQDEQASKVAISSYALINRLMRPAV